MKTAVIYLGDDRAYSDRPMVELNYIRGFEAHVVERGSNYVVLDKTAFYAEGGGQPWDTGWLKWDEGSTDVWKVVKEGGEIRHYVHELPPEEEVEGELDWDRRYNLMKMHTAQHLLSGLVWNQYGAKTVGNSLRVDFDTQSRRNIYYSHVDFAPVHFEDADLTRMETAFNEAVAEAHPVTVYEEDREVLEEEIAEERAILDLIPKSIRRLRVIHIGDVDLCPCGGTHVRNTSEIGRMRVLRRRSKGKDVDRVTYELVD